MHTFFSIFLLFLGISSAFSLQHDFFDLNLTPAENELNQHNTAQIDQAGSSSSNEPNVKGILETYQIAPFDLQSLGASQNWKNSNKHTKLYASLEDETLQNYFKNKFLQLFSGISLTITTKRSVKGQDPNERKALRSGKTLYRLPGIDVPAYFSLGTKFSENQFKANHNPLSVDFWIFKSISVNDVTYIKRYNLDTFSLNWNVAEDKEAFGRILSHERFKPFLIPVKNKVSRLRVG